MTLHLQLAEESSKRSGDFETSYKNESGKEITVKRSSDGKFASKGGGSTSSNSEPKSTAGKESDGAQVFKDLLSGKLGNQLKKGIVDSIDKNSTIKDFGAKIGIALNELDIKTGVQQAQFSEIVGKGSDVIGNTQKYIKSKLDEIKAGASDSETCKNIGKTLVAGLVVSAVAGLAVAAMGASAPAIAGTVVAINSTTLVLGAMLDDVRISKRNHDNFKNRFAIAAKKDADEKFVAMLKKFDDDLAQQVILEDIATVAAVKSGQSNSQLDTKVKDLEKRADDAQEAMNKAFDDLDAKLDAMIRE